MARPKLSLHAFLLALAALAAIVALRFPSVALGQAMNHSTDGTSKLMAQTDVERATFAALTCSCGSCPHESLSTCPCGFADNARTELRAMIASGMSLEAIKTAWAKTHGTDSLAMPPNTGAHRFIYLVPLTAIVAMAAVAIGALGRFRRRSDESARAAAAAAPAGDAAAAGDDYDDKLDDELKQLDRE